MYRLKAADQSASAQFGRDHHAVSRPHRNSGLRTQQELESRDSVWSPGRHGRLWRAIPDGRSVPSAIKPFCGQKSPIEANLTPRIMTTGHKLKVADQFCATQRKIFLTEFRFSSLIDSPLAIWKVRKHLGHSGDVYVAIK
jgi:hypothetical protein